jgi:hypothetical protein
VRIYKFGITIAITNVTSLVLLVPVAFVLCYTHNEKCSSFPSSTCTVSVNKHMMLSG